MGMATYSLPQHGLESASIPGFTLRVANDQVVYSDTFLRSQENRTPTGHSEARVYGAYLTDASHFLILKIL